MLSCWCFWDGLRHGELQPGELVGLGVQPVLLVLGENLQHPQDVRVFRRLLLEDKNRKSRVFLGSVRRVIDACFTLEEYSSKIALKSNFTFTFGAFGRHF